MGIVDYIVSGKASHNPAPIVVDNAQEPVDETPIEVFEVNYWHRVAGQLWADGFSARAYARIVGAVVEYVAIQRGWNDNGSIVTRTRVLHTRAI